MQNNRMIEEERQAIAGLVEQLQVADPDNADRIAGNALNAAVSLRRGLPCGRTALSVCIDCKEIGAVATPVCDYREQH